LTNVQSGEAIQLQQPIDNTEGDLYVGLKSIFYSVGWYNLTNHVNSITLWGVTGQPAFTNVTSSNVITDKAGLVSYTTLASNINACSTQCSITLDQTTGKITLTVNSGYYLYISSSLSAQVGISSLTTISASLPYYPGIFLNLMKYSAGIYERSSAINPH